MPKRGHRGPPKKITEAQMNYIYEQQIGYHVPLYELAQILNVSLARLRREYLVWKQASKAQSNDPSLSRISRSNRNLS